MAQIYYFNPCCGGLEPFGIPNNSFPFVPWNGFTDTIGTQYGVIVGSYSGCVEYSGSSTTNLGFEIKNYGPTPPIFYAYDCELCTQSIFPCYTPPVVVPPIIVGYKNECGIITILPMVVECEVSNPTTSDSKDGEVSVSITGGTAPYTVTWLNNGNISPALNNVGNGFYTATTVDFYGDYTATTVCELYTEKNCTFEVSISETYVDECLPTAMSGYTFDLT